LFIPKIVLSLFGDTEGIQIDRDQALLEQLRGIEAVVLEEPDRNTLNNYFWDEQGWDILFFAGHSLSENDGSAGQLKINSNENISIAQLKHGLKTAIQRGLKLAIFNSCDGIGLAKELADLHIPYLIIMREGVPDRVAQAFLMNFLRPFANEETLYLAVREARERLQGLENQFPCASWLPVICQNPSTLTFSWQLSQSRAEQSHLPRSRAKDTAHEKQSKIRDRISFQASSLKITVIGSLLVTALIIVTRALSLLQPIELNAYDHMMRVRPINEGTDNRITIITVGQADIEYQREQGFQGGEASLKDEALLQILEKLEPAKPAAIGLDIIHDFPFIPQVSEYISQNPNFFAICRVGIETSRLESTSAPDSSFPVAQMGFSNFPLDKDGKIRRQFLGMAPDEICQTDESLSFRMATQYIENNDHLLAQVPNLTPERINENNLRIGHFVFRKVNRTSGGYNLPDGEDAGFQVLVNYRKSQPRTISLRSFLTLGASRIQLEFKNKIVLIGGLTPKDLHLTPFDQGWSKTPGVIIHAQMTSNLISAFLDNRNLIHWWPQWLENAWILIWALGGAVATSLFRMKFSSNFWAVFGIIFSLEAFLYGICLLLFTKGVWIPWIPSMLSLLFGSLIALFLADRYEKLYLKSIQARESRNFS
jgi:CHASE2 domain-containing sensor protein